MPSRGRIHPPHTWVARTPVPQAQQRSRWCCAGVRDERRHRARFSRQTTLPVVISWLGLQNPVIDCCSAAYDCPVSFCRLKEQPPGHPRFPFVASLTPPHSPAAVLRRLRTANSPAIRGVASAPHLPKAKLKSAGRGRVACRARQAHTRACRYCTRKCTNFLVPKSTVTKSSGVFDSSLSDAG